MRRACVVTVALLLTVAGCGHDLPGWKVASTPHFRLYTDQRAGAFEPVLDHLESVYAGLSSSLFSGNVPQTEVFLFGATEFASLLGPVGGVAMGGVGKSGVLAIYEGWDPYFIDRTAAHELAHAFIHATYRSPPIWFNEGLATYAESIMVQERAVLLGSNKVHVADAANSRQLIPVAQLFSAASTRFHGEWEARHYTTAWAVVHYIWHGENKSLRRRFDAFGAALSGAARTPGGSASAWATVFPEIPLAELDGRLRDHLTEVFNRSKDSVVGFKFTPVERPPTELAPAEMAYVDQVRAQLRTHRRADRW